MAESVDILQGTLDMLILKAASLGRLHGYGILLRIQQISGDALQIPQGSIYPALYRLEAGGFIKAEWGESENSRRSKYYELTKSGRAKLKQETAYWERLTRAIGQVLKTTEA
jgi:PadR family transcriptional regulator PadR